MKKILKQIFILLIIKLQFLYLKNILFFGSGIKNFRVEVKKIIDDEFKDDKNYNNWQVITTHPHQINFEILAETGIFGFICFFIFFNNFYFCFQKNIEEKMIFF